MHRAWIIGFGVLSALVLVLISFESTLTSERFYEGEFTKLKVYERVGNQTPTNLTQTLLAYYTSKSKTLELNYLTENEVSHYRDVGVIVRITLFLRGLLSITWLISLAIIGYVERKKFIETIGAAYKMSGICTLVLVGLIGIAIILFVPFFTIFHTVLFPQGNYLFPPESITIQVFPQEFFSDFLQQIAFKTLISGIVLFLIGKFMMRKRSR